MAEIVEVTTPAEVDAVRMLFAEYKQAVGVDLWFGSAFQKELDGLPHPYAPPGGVLLLAREGDEVAGCVAARPHSPGTAELRRLWVRRPFRKKGLARDLMQALAAWAKEAGYRKARMEVLSVMPAGRAALPVAGVRVDPGGPSEPVPAAPSSWAESC